MIFNGSVIKRLFVLACNLKVSKSILCCIISFFLIRSINYNMCMLIYIINCKQKDVLLYVIHACALIIHIKLRLSITGSALRSHPGMAVPK